LDLFVSGEKTATVRCPGSCGELAQGSIGGRNFLITCPIELYSEVTVAIGQSEESCKIEVGSKVNEAVIRTFRHFNIPLLPHQVKVHSDLPEGKGMASSSADISAACLATATVLGRDLDLNSIADIALSIEPTDGVFFPGIMMFDHVKGLTRQQLGMPIPLLISVFDVGGEVDTLRFNERIDLADLNHAKEPQIRQALEYITTGLEQGSAELVGKGTTLSALANQVILPKPFLNEVIQLAGQHGAVGINVAHSGTVLGVLFDLYNSDRSQDCIQAIACQYPAIRYMKTVHLISGGLEVISR